MDVEGAVVGDGAVGNRTGAGQIERGAGGDGGDAAIGVDAGQRLGAGGERQGAGAGDHAGKGVAERVAQRQRLAAEDDRAGGGAGQAGDGGAGGGDCGNVEGAVVDDVAAGGDRAGAGQIERGAGGDGGDAAIGVDAGQRLGAGE